MAITSNPNCLGDSWQCSLTQTGRETRGIALYLSGELIAISVHFIYSNIFNPRVTRAVSDCFSMEPKLDLIQNATNHGNRPIPSSNNQQALKYSLTTNE